MNRSRRANISYDINYCERRSRNSINSRRSAVRGEARQARPCPFEAMTPDQVFLDPDDKTQIKYLIAQQLNKKEYIFYLL